MTEIKSFKYTLLFISLFIFGLIKNKVFLEIFLIIFIIGSSNYAYSAEKKVEFIKNNWSFDGVFGTFDRASLRRGYQVYNLSLIHI